MMTVLRVCLPFLILSPVIQAFFIQMLPLDSVMTKGNGQALCQTHGLSLPILPTEIDWQDFLNAVKVISDSQGQDYWNFQPWMGLTRESGNTTSPEDYTWSDGQQATYLAGNALPQFNGEAGHNVSCVRLYCDSMRVTYCKWKRHVFCQGDAHSLNSSPFPLFYMKREPQQENVTSNQMQTVTYYDAFVDPSQFPVPLRMRNLGVEEMDTVDCFHLCAQSTSCHVVAVLRDDTACFFQA